HVGQRCRIMHNQARLPAAVRSGELQVDARVQVDVAYSAPGRHIRVPAGGVFAVEIGDPGDSAVQRLQAWVRVGSHEAQLQVNSLTWTRQVNGVLGVVTQRLGARGTRGVQ